MQFRFRSSWSRSYFPKQTLMATKQTNKPAPLQVGDLVRVIETTHDDDMPSSRTGLIVEAIGPERTSHPTAPSTQIFMVRFGALDLKFHAMFLEKIS